MYGLASHRTGEQYNTEHNEREVVLGRTAQGSNVDVVFKHLNTKSAGK